MKMGINVLFVALLVVVCSIGVEGRRCRVRRCPPGYTCNEDETCVLEVQDACAENPCPELTVCSNQDCEEYDEECVPYACYDPCIATTCLEGTVCVPVEDPFAGVIGQCVQDPCAENPCPELTVCSNQDCEEDDEGCVPYACYDPCIATTCLEGTVCVPVEDPFAGVIGQCVYPSQSCLADGSCPSEFYECDSITDTCVPVDCAVKDVCEEGYTCVPREIFCIRAPCQQFVCEPDEPAVEFCETNCGQQIAVGETYTDDGANNCNTCTCTSSGPVCTRVFCVEPEECEVDEPAVEFCETSCGKQVAVGESYTDDGTNNCNSCICTSAGPVCTRVFCVEPEECEQTPSCLTQCEKKIEVGVSFKDDGTNNCNTCVCLEGGGKICTEAFCLPEECVADNGNYCTTNCGLKVPEGVTFTNDGTDYCNSCECTANGKVCTEAACDISNVDASC